MNQRDHCEKETNCEPKGLFNPLEEKKSKLEPLRNLSTSCKNRPAKESPLVPRLILITHCWDPQRSMHNSMKEKRAGHLCNHLCKGSKCHAKPFQVWRQVHFAGGEWGCYNDINMKMQRAWEIWAGQKIAQSRQKAALSVQKSVLWPLLLIPDGFSGWDLTAIFLRATLQREQSKETTCIWFP